MQTLLTIGHYAASRSPESIPSPGLFKLNAIEQIATLLTPLTLAELAYELYGDYEYWQTHVIPLNRYQLKDKCGLDRIAPGTEIHFSTVDLTPPLRNKVAAIQQLHTTYNTSINQQPYLHIENPDIVCMGTESDYIIRHNYTLDPNFKISCRWQIQYDQDSARGISRKYTRHEHFLLRNTNENGRIFSVKMGVLGANTVFCLANTTLVKYKRMVVTADEYAAILACRPPRITPAKTIIHELKKRTPANEYKDWIEHIQEHLNASNKFPMTPIAATYFATEDRASAFDLSLFLRAENLETKDDRGSAQDASVSIYDFTFKDVRVYHGAGATIDAAIEQAVARYGDGAPLPNGKVIIRINHTSLPYGLFSTRACTADVSNTWTLANLTGQVATASLVLGLTAAVAGQAEIAAPCLYFSGIVGGMSATAQIIDRYRHEDLRWDLRTGANILDIATQIIGFGAAKRVIHLVGTTDKLTIVGKINMGMEVAQIGIMGEEHRRKIASATASNNTSKVIMSVFDAIQEGALILIIHKAGSGINKLQTLDYITGRRMAGGFPNGPQRIPGNNTPKDAATVAHDQMIDRLEVGTITTARTFNGPRLNVPEGNRLYQKTKTYDEAYRFYEEALHAVGNEREVAIFRNRHTGEFQVVVGTSVSVGPILNGRADYQAWEGVLHFHPGAEETALFRMPSVHDVYSLMMTNFGRVRKEFIEFPITGGKRGRTGYQIDSESGKVTIQFSDGTQTFERTFMHLGDFDEYWRGRTIFVDPENPMSGTSGPHEYSELYRDLMWQAADKYGHKLPFARPNGFDKKTAGSSQVPNLADLDILKIKAKTDPDAVWELIDCYRLIDKPTLIEHAKTDTLARAVLDARTYPQHNTSLATITAGQGSFSEPYRFFLLADTIKDYRREVGIRRSGRSVIAPDDPVVGGTAGAAQSNIDGLEYSILGASRNAGGEFNLASPFKPAIPFDAPNGAAKHGHAEQQIVDQYHELLKDMPPASYKNKTIWMLIEQEPCSSCRQGIKNTGTEPGVLAKFSALYPDITIELRNLNDSSIQIIKGGKAVN